MQLLVSSVLVLSFASEGKEMRDGRKIMKTSILTTKFVAFIFIRVFYEDQLYLLYKVKVRNSEVKETSLR